MKYSIVITNKRIPELEAYLLEGMLNKYYIAQLNSEITDNLNLILMISVIDDNITRTTKVEIPGENIAILIS